MKTDLRSNPFVFLAGVLVGLVVCYALLRLKEVREETLEQASLYPGKDFPLAWCEQCVHGWTPKDTALVLEAQPMWLDANLFVMKSKFQNWCLIEGHQFDHSWLASRTHHDLRTDLSVATKQSDSH
ncbi:MAG: hypothetical protein NXI32_02045 [bacterium]|nr:hypothetical protein [bacterium]